VTKHSVIIAETELTDCLTCKVSSILINSYEKEFSIPHCVAIHCDLQVHNPSLNELLTVVHILGSFLCKVTVVLTAESLTWDVCVPLVYCVPPVNSACCKLRRWPRDIEGSCIYTGEGVRLYCFGQVAKIPSPHKPACYKILHSLRIGPTGGLL
jgi:hypothetical protein